MIARGNEYQIERVRGGPGFIQIVHAPDEASFFVAPRPEVFDMQIAYTQYGWGFRQMSANLRPELQPAVEGGAEERESGFRHVLVLEREILPNDRELPGQPVLEIGRGFEDVHAEPIGFPSGLNVGMFDSRWTASQTRLIDRESRGKFRYLFAHALLDFSGTDVREDFRDPGADLLHLRFAHAACGDRRAAQPDSAALHRGQGIKWNRILIYGHPCAVEGFFLVLSSNPSPLHFLQKQMVVRAAGDDTKPVLGDGRRHGFGVGHDLLLVFLEGRL